MLLLQTVNFIVKLFKKATCICSLEWRGKKSMEAKIQERNAAWQDAIRTAAAEVAPEYMNIDCMSVDELILNVLLNDELSDVTASDWDTKYFRKEYGLKALFCGGEINKLPPTIREAFELAEEIFSKLPSAFDEKVLDSDINKKKYGFSARGEEAHFDNVGTSLGAVIRVDVRTNLEKGQLIYWNQGYAKGKMKDRREHLAKVYVLNFVEEFDEDQAITKAQLLKAKGIKAVDLF